MALIITALASAAKAIGGKALSAAAKQAIAKGTIRNMANNAINWLGSEAGQAAANEAIKKAGKQIASNMAKNAAQQAIGPQAMELIGDTRTIVDVLAGRMKPSQAIYEMTRTKVPKYVQKAISFTKREDGKGYDVTLNLSEGAYNYLRKTLSVDSLERSIAPAGTYHKVTSAKQFANQQATNAIKFQLNREIDNIGGNWTPAGRLADIMRKKELSIDDIAEARRMLTNPNEMARNLARRTPGGDLAWHATYDEDLGTFRPNINEMANRLWEYGRRSTTQYGSTSEDYVRFGNMLNAFATIAGDKNIILPNLSQGEIDKDPTKWLHQLEKTIDRGKFVELVRRAGENIGAANNWDAFDDNAVIYNFLRGDMISKRNWDYFFPRRLASLQAADQEKWAYKGFVLKYNADEIVNFDNRQEADWAYMQFRKIYDTFEWQVLKRRATGYDSEIVYTTINYMKQGGDIGTVRKALAQASDFREYLDIINDKMDDMLKRGAAFNP